MPWFPVDTHFLEDPKVRRAGMATPFAIPAYVALLASAKLRAQGGKVEVMYCRLAFDLCISEEDASKAIGALVMARLIDVESQDDESARVAFPAATWRRRNESFRKQEQRDKKAA